MVKLSIRLRIKCLFTWCGLSAGLFALSNVHAQTPIKPDEFTCEPFRGVEIRVSDREAIGSETVGQALAVVRDRGGLRLPIAYTVQEGDTACQIAISKIGWPDRDRGECANSILTLLQSMNEGVNLAHLQVGQVIQLPKVCIETRSYTAEIRREGGGAQLLEKLGVSAQSLPKQKASDDYYDQVTLIRYIIKIPMEDSALAKRIADDTMLRYMPDVTVQEVGYGSSDQFRLYSEDGIESNGIVPPQGEPAKPILIKPSQFHDIVIRDGNCPENDKMEGDLFSLLPWSIFDENREKLRRNCGKECPQIVILDPGSAEESHPDFHDPWKWNKEKRCYFQTELPDDQKSYHATGLLGIISAKQNGRGLVGVFPEAGANVEQLTYDLIPTSEIILQRMKPRRWLYVVASSWKDDPTTHVALSEAVVTSQESALWIVAAGQNTTGNRGREIRDDDIESPMNLGDYPNVVVVTACDACGPSKGKLLESANHSNKFVHVAGPGKEIPTTYLNESFMNMSGTSPATAFVGGIAAALWSSEVGKKLRDPPDMKARLQVTARPMMFADNQNDWLATGVVDPNLLALDPQTVFLRRPEKDVHLPIEVEAWCNSQPDPLTIIHPTNGRQLGNEPYASQHLIRRIVRADDTDEGKGWFFYLASVDDKYQVVEWRIRRKGPGTLFPVQGPNDSVGKKLPLLKMKDGSKLSLHDIADLIGNPAIATTRGNCQ